jgi:hypothetical protein
MNRKYFYHFTPKIRRIVHSTSLSYSPPCSTYTLHVTKEIKPDKKSTMVLLISPVFLKRIGKLNMAPPSILLSMARTVVAEEFFLASLVDMIIITVEIKCLNNNKSI